MAICTFFGHRYAPLTEAEKEKLTASITDLIENHDVTEFWVGAKGEFDSLCSYTVRQLKEKFPNIKLALVLSYIPTNKEDYEWKERYYDHIFYQTVLRLVLSDLRSQGATVGCLSTQIT